MPGNRPRSFLGLENRLRSEHRSRAEGNRAHYEVLQFTHVSRPVEGIHQAPEIVRNAVDGARWVGVFCEECRHEERDVGFSRAQRRHLYGNYIQTIIEITSKPSVIDADP